MEIPPRPLPVCVFQQIEATSGRQQMTSGNPQETRNRNICKRLKPLPKKPTDSVPLKSGAG
jgi:hypothetical protein